MDQTRDDVVAQKLAELKARFAATQTKDLALLARNIDALAQGHGDADALQASYQKLHRLAGSAGTLGFPALSQEARELEQRLKPLALNSALDPDTLTEVLDFSFRARVNRLSRLLEEEL